MASSAPTLIIGAGAVGCFVGARLALGDIPVALVGRPPLVDAVRRNGLKLVEPEGERTARDVKAYASLAEAFAAGSYGSAILTVKAYDTAGAVAELLSATTAPPPVLSLQNGIGNEEALAAALGADNVIAGAIETPLSIPAPGTVVAHRARYAVGVAPLGSAELAALIASDLRAGGLQVDSYDDYRRLKWSKLLLNLPANAACAILDWTPAQVMAHPLTAQLEARGWQEAFRVMRGHGIAPVAIAGYPLPALASVVTRVPPSLLARLLRRTVAGGRGSKAPSLHQALTAGKRSEVAWLNGAVAAGGVATGIPTPVNRALTDVLSALTQGRADRAGWRDQPVKLANLVG